MIIEQFVSENGKKDVFSYIYCNDTTKGFALARTRIQRIKDDCESIYEVWMDKRDNYFGIEIGYRQNNVQKRFELCSSLQEGDGYKNPDMLDIVKMMC